MYDIYVNPNISLNERFYDENMNLLSYSAYSPNLRSLIIIMQTLHREDIISELKTSMPASQQMQELRLSHTISIIINTQTLTTITILQAVLADIPR